MSKKAIWLITGFLMIGATVVGQCNYRLVEKAAEQAGTDAVYIRDFKVKLSQGTMDEPSPTGKFPVYLNRGVIYRFSVVNADEFAGKAIVEITRRDQVYAGNYDFSRKIYSETFDYVCDRSSTYQLLINYGEGKEGCSAIVMAMVLQDSMVYIEPGLPEKSDSAGTLYLFSDNQLQIASSAGKNARLDVSISQGTIEKKGQYFIAKPTNLGEVQIKVTVIKDDLITEIDSVIYKVEYPPLPQIELPGESAGTISLIKFNGVGPVLLSGIAGNGMSYQLKQFSISPERDLVNEAISDGDKISAQQILMIKKLTPGSKIYIHNVVFIDPDGNPHKGISREVIITD